MKKPCKRCGRSFKAMRRALYCSTLCKRQVDPSHFWANVDQSNGWRSCWPWLLSTDKFGYGWYSVGTTMRHAHRVALELHLGRRLERLECSLHSCDNPPCVNPRHLHLGTHANNYAEMKKRGRERHACGPANQSTKLTPKQVRRIRSIRKQWQRDNPASIRARGAASTTSLADQYNVSTPTITAIIRNRTHMGIP